MDTETSRLGRHAGGAGGALDLLIGVGQAERILASRVPAPARKIPLVLLTGFLGAGKTTLLNRLLAEPGGRRLAVLVNDFGQVNIDAALVRQRAPGVISLTNGCACCSLAGGLTRALLEVSRLPEAPDCAVMEASGIADPAALLHTALSNPAYGLGAVLTLVDTAGVLPQLADEALAGLLASQVAIADMVVLNKTDLSNDATVHKVHAWIRAINPRCRTLHARHAAIPAELVLGPDDCEYRLTPQAAAPGGHATKFRTWRWTSHQPLDRRRFTAVMASPPASLLRAKGFVFLRDDKTHRNIFQLVGARPSWERSGPWPGDARSDMVFICLAEQQDGEAARWMQAIAESEV